MWIENFTFYKFCSHALNSSQCVSVSRFFGNSACRNEIIISRILRRILRCKESMFPSSMMVFEKLACEFIEIWVLKLKLKCFESQLILKNLKLLLLKSIWFKKFSSKKSKVKSTTNNRPKPQIPVTFITNHSSKKNPPSNKILKLTNDQNYKSQQFRKCVKYLGANNIRRSRSLTTGNIVTIYYVHIRYILSHELNELNTLVILSSFRDDDRWMCDSI